jgi:putative DNA methylase
VGEPPSLICELEASGEIGTSAPTAKLGSEAEIAREFCHRLYTLCERKTGG